MAVQTQVRKYMAVSTAGTISKAIHSYYLPQQGLVADANVVAGGFVKTKTSSTGENEVYGATGQAYTAGTDKIVGVCIKDHLVNSIGDTNSYPVGTQIQYLTKGAIYIETNVQAKKGQYVCLVIASGALAFVDTKPASDDTTNVYTGFIANSSSTSSSSTTSEIIEIISEY